MLNPQTTPRAVASTPPRTRGFSVVELMIGVALMGLLAALAAPSFSDWLRNARVRTVADALQSGLRLGQAEAVRRYRQVVLFRTASQVCNETVTASNAGNFWALRTVALTAGDPVETVRCGVLADVAAGVTINGPTALCFSAGGRQIANADPGVGGAACAVPGVTAPSSYDVASSNGVAGRDRPLRVLVTLGGSVRMCDPAKTLSATHPDGCPP
ncbi:MAG TPA: prepilin-type N-terminal cleavage/methylation domain-containing protein [Rubrivivax sp.]|nr:prepilin-type N-terminal cleavage/methylation domain-containing protein [Rubrivivax sp.]